MGTRVGVRSRWRALVVGVCGFWLAAGIGAGAQQIAITFDDLPAHGPLPPGETRIRSGEKVIRALEKAHVPPTYGFVNGIGVEQHPETVAVLAAWRAAGNPLGNHTWSHMNLNQHSLPQFEQRRGEERGPAGICRCRRGLALVPVSVSGGGGQYAPKRWAFRVYLAQHGYQDRGGDDASFADYEWNEPYARCEREARWEGDRVAGAQLFAGGGARISDFGRRCRSSCTTGIFLTCC
jgi:peptidoglycan/xylan/chitin deacetylase (PgdA/CDA1 family)